MLVRLKAIVNPTEDEEKVRRALSNLIPPNVEIEEHREVEKDYMRLWLTCKGRECLSTIHRMIRDRKVVDAFRRVLTENVKNGKISIMLNKQAAFVGTVTLCEEESESPMGPIVLEIESDQIMELIDWLAPKTQGAPFNRDRQV